MSKEATPNIVESVLAASASKREAECRLAEMAIGVIAALRSAKISIDDSYWDLFNITAYQALRRHRMCPDLKQLFTWGMELEDVEEIAPQGLQDSYKAIEELAGKILVKRTRQPKHARLVRLQVAGQ